MLKKFIMSFFRACLLALVLPVTLFAGDFQVEDQPQVLERILRLEQKGILKQMDNGYLYLDVSNDYIAFALESLDVPGKLVPPGHYTSRKGIGAHISVMYENEMIRNDVWEIKELGQEYSFAITEIRSVKINKNGKMQKLWIIAAEARELEKLRESYNLSPLLNNHDFHITIGAQVPGNAQKLEFIVEESLEEQEAA